MPSMLFFPIFPFRRLRKEGYRGIVLTEAMAMPFVKIVATSALISFAMAVAYVYHNEQRKQKEKWIACLSQFVFIDLLFHLKL